MLQGQGMLGLGLLLGQLPPAPGTSPSAQPAPGLKPLWPHCRQPCLLETAMCLTDNKQPLLTPKAMVAPTVQIPALVLLAG